MKELLKEIKTSYKSFSGSKRFWNNCVILFAIILPFINLTFAILAAAVGSVIFLGLILDGKEDENYWWVVTPLCWIFFLVFVLYEIGSWLNNKIFEPFNSWLDKKLK